MDSTPAKSTGLQQARSSSSSLARFAHPASSKPTSDYHHQAYEPDAPSSDAPHASSSAFDPQRTPSLYFQRSSRRSAGASSTRRGSSSSGNALAHSQHQQDYASSSPATDYLATPREIHHYASSDDAPAFFAGSQLQYAAGHPFQPQVYFNPAAVHDEAVAYQHRHQARYMDAKMELEHQHFSDEHQHADEFADTLAALPFDNYPAKQQHLLGGSTSSSASSSSQGPSLTRSSSSSSSSSRSSTSNTKIADPSRWRAYQPSVTRTAEDNSSTQQMTEQALALAQAHGITPDQFEAAKLQIMRYLGNGTPGASDDPSVIASLAAAGRVAAGEPTQHEALPHHQQQPYHHPSPHSRTTPRSPKATSRGMAMDAILERSASKRSAVDEDDDDGGVTRPSAPKADENENGQQDEDAGAISSTDEEPDEGDDDDDDYVSGADERATSRRRGKTAAPARGRRTGATRGSRRAAASRRNSTASFDAQMTPAPVTKPRVTFSDLPSLTTSAGRTAKRARDVFSSGDQLDSSKRTRWEQMMAGPGAPSSPCPSSAASGSMRAPSFCDSSPALSDPDASAPVAGTSSAHLQQPTHHRGSAVSPSYYSTGIQPVDAPQQPLYSPASSTYSYADQQPAPKFHRSSPGPSFRREPTPEQREPQRLVPTSAPAGKQRRSAAAAASAPPSQGTVGKPVPSGRAGLPQVGPHYGTTKPPFSYAALIGQAIFSTDESKISLNDIYEYIMSMYPFYKKEDAGWQNSIRHNLSLNDCFVKTARGPNNPGKGCLWTVLAGCEDQFADGGFTKRGAPVKKAGGRGRGSAVYQREESSSPAPPPMSSRGRSARLSRSQSAVRDHSGSRAPLQHHYSMPPPVSAPPMASSPAHHAMPAPSPVMEQPRQPEVVFEQPEAASQPPSLSQHMSSQLVAPSISPSTSADSLNSVPSPQLEPVIERVPSRAESMQLAPAYVPQSGVAQTSPATAYTDHFGTGAHDLRQPRTSPPPHHHVISSPPTSVFNRLSGPYQPMPRSRTITSENRARALMSSPELGGVGIFAGGPATLDSLPSRSRASLGPSASAPFLGASAGDGRVTSEAERALQEARAEFKASGGMMWESTLVHHRSPVSSLRGGPRNRSPSREDAEDDSRGEDDEGHTSAEDAERPRPATLAFPSSATTSPRARPRNVASIVAAEAADGDGTFKTPPRAIRSPNKAPTAGSALADLKPGTSSKALQAALTSPSRLSTPAQRGWGSHAATSSHFGEYSDDIEAELARYGSSELASSVAASGGSTYGPRMYYPSPSAGGHTYRVPMTPW